LIEVTLWEGLCTVLTQARYIVKVTFYVLNINMIIIVWPHIFMIHFCILIYKLKTHCDGLIQNVPVLLLNCPQLLETDHPLIRTLLHWRKIGLIGGGLLNIFDQDKIKKFTVNWHKFGLIRGCIILRRII
jgi:hypothetical protein